MKYLYTILGLILGGLLMVGSVAYAVSATPVPFGGTGSTTLSGILIGNGTSPVNTLTIGSNLTLSGTTLSATGGGNSFAWPFTAQSYGNSTSTTIGFLNGLFSNGSTTVSSLGSGLVGNNNGLLYGLASSSLFGFIPYNFAYPFPAGATSSPLMLLASTTIGDGTQAGGLTISGGATTTLNQYVGGNAYVVGNIGVGTTTPQQKIVIPTNSYYSAANTTGGTLTLIGVNGANQIQVGSGASDILFSTAAHAYFGSLVSSGGAAPGTINTLTFTADGERIAWGGNRALEGTASTANLLKVGESYTNTALYGKVGIASTSPYATLSVGGDVVIGASTAGGTLGNLYLPALGTTAGTFLAVNAAGKVIATTTPASGSSASSTLLGDTNTFSGTDTFSNTISGSITGNAGTVTNGVYTTTFNGLFDNRLSASSSISGIATLPNLSSINSYSGLLAGNTGKLFQVSTTSMNASITGSSGSVANSVTFNSSGGAAANSTFNGSGALTVDYHTVGAQVAGNYATFAFPFTPFTSYNATTTAIGFTNGAFTNGSTTIASLGSGLVGANNGLLYGFASSSLFGYTPLNPTRNINTTGPITGGGDLSADRTIAITQSSGSADGYLSSENWLTFNNKVATGTNFVSGNLPYWGANGTLFNVATTSATCGSGVTCTGFNVLGSSNPSFALATINAGVLGAVTNGSTPTSQATSTLFGTGTPGQHLAWLNGVPSWTATTTFSCSSGVTCTFSGNQESYSIANDALTLAMLPTLPAGDIWANNTAATGNALAIATSSIFGTGTGGQVLAWNNGVPQWVGTTTNSCSNGVTCTFSGTTWTFSAPGAAFPFTPTTYNAIAVNSTTTPLYVTSAASGFGLIASSTFATYASSTQATIASSFYIDGFGNVTAKDVSTGDTGLLSPHQHLTLQTGTTTTWTATTSGPYIPLTIATFSGTLKFAKCYATSTTATDAFLGTEIDINGAPVTPKYLIASTTLGTTTLTAANTFKTGDRISAKFGTTTTAGTTYSASCTIDAVQTS